MTWTDPIMHFILYFIVEILCLSFLCLLSGPGFSFHFYNFCKIVLVAIISELSVWNYKILCIKVSMSDIFFLIFIIYLVILYWKCWTCLAFCHILYVNDPADEKLSILQVTHHILITMITTIKNVKLEMLRIILSLTHHIRLRLNQLHMKFPIWETIAMVGFGSINHFG